MIKERQERSVFWRTVHVMGSLQLALVLLATIAVACAVATFFESEFNAKIARHYIYQAPWFLFWLGVLCLNLFAVTLTRWPWQKRHLGFVITHYGIITVLIGAVIGALFGFEGNVTLEKDRPPVGRATTSRSIVQIDDPRSPALLVKPFDASVTRPREERPIRLPVPGTDWSIVATDASDNLMRREALQAVAGGAFGAELVFKSATAGRDIDMVLLAGDARRSAGSLSGMAGVRLLRELPEATIERQGETRMVLAKFSPVSTGDSTGVRVSLDESGEMVRIGDEGGAMAVYRVADVLGKTVDAGAATVEVLDFWNDLTMRDGIPANASGEMKNPALLVRISEEIRTSGDVPKGLLVELAPADAGLLARFSRDGAIVSETVLSRGVPIATGWNDWTIELRNSERQAAVAEVVGAAGQSAAGEPSGVPGFLAHLEAGDEPPGAPIWVESGKVTTLIAGTNRLRVGYGLQLRELPFFIRLLNFEVPRFEGTSSPANFISTVEFQPRAGGGNKVDEAKMNKPANWPGGFWPMVTGWNYKFSQAGWNPQNLNETTLQVLYDPGWLFKWIGSLAICCGIFLLFYWKPRTNRP